MAYTEQFPRSNRTEKWASLFPAWMSLASNPDSIWQQFVNAPALMLDASELATDNSVKNRFIGQANTDELAWVYKIKYDAQLDSANHTVIGNIEGASPIQIPVVATLREFYSSPESCIFDEHMSTLYVRKRYDSVLIDDTHTYSNMTLHHIWNCFDEFALMFNLRRRSGESNVQLKQRTLQAMQYLASSTSMGIVFGLATQLGLVRALEWLETDSDTITVGSVTPPVTPYPDSIMIGERRVRPEEYSINENGTIDVSRIVRAYPDDDIDIDGCIVEDGIIRLSDNAVTGSATTSPISIANLLEWRSMITQCIVPDDTNISVDVLWPDTDYPIVSGLQPSAQLLISSDPETWIRIPVRLRFHLSRSRVAVASPSIESCMLTYKGSDCVVNFIARQDVSVNEMCDETFRRMEMFNVDGEPTEEMLHYVSELSDIAPVVWGRCKWDQGFWDVVDDKLTGMKWLANHIDPDISGVPIAYKQIGVGDKSDTHVRLGDPTWSVNVHAGYYYIGNDLSEHYLYANPRMDTFTGPVAAVTTSALPASHAPIVVLADGKYLTQVAFLSNNYRYSIVNTEKAIGEGSANLSVSYSNLDINSVVVAGYTVNKAAYTGDNVIPLTTVVGAGTIVDVSYRVKDSFIVEVSEETARIILSQAYTSVQTTYELGSEPYYVDSQLTVSPVRTHINRGFIYIANQAQAPVSMSISAHPDVVRADGQSRVVICADACDIYGNPCSIDSSWFSASTNYGTISRSDTYANRTVFLYTAPSSVPTDGKATITITDGNAASATAIIIVR